MPTITRRASCACGHPAAHHEAGTCWTDQEGAQVQDSAACQCGGFEALAALVREARGLLGSDDEAARAGFVARKAALLAGVTS